jgi:hypothetical protein
VVGAKRDVSIPMGKISMLDNMLSNFDPAPSINSSTKGGICFTNTL